MSRGQGRLYKRGGVWWIDYSVRGHRYRESTDTTSHREAVALLSRRTEGRRAGKLLGNPDAVTFANLRALIEQDYALKGNSSTDRLADALHHLETHFRPEALALEITETAIDTYAAERLKAAKLATVNYERAILRRMFRLGMEKHLLATAPKVAIPKVHNEREGFFTAGDLAAVLLELKDPLLERYIRVKAITGWRDKELKGLLWTSVDRERREIRVMPASTKAKVPLLFDYGAVPDVQAIVEALWADHRGPYVFQRRGKPLKDYRGAWKNACTRAGLAGRIPHDLRRSAARDWRAFMSEKEIMRLCGWKSRSVFERYNIVSPEDVKAGIARRFASGTVQAQPQPAEQSEEELS